MTVTLKISIEEFKDMVIAGKDKINFNRTKNLNAPNLERDVEDREIEL